MLKHWSNEDSSIRTHKANNISKYLFCTLTEGNYKNNKILNQYFEDYKNIELNAYKDCKNKLPSIPSETRKYLDNFYEQMCSFVKIKKCESNIDYEIYKKRSYRPYEYHHIVPKEWFQKQYKNPPIEVMHNRINLIPLCEVCHNDMRSKNKDIKGRSFKNVINLYRHIKKFDSFCEFLTEQCHITLNILALMYGLKGGCNV